MGAFSEEPAATDADTDLWVTHSSRIEDPQLLERYRALLTTDELAQESRYRHPKVRHQYLVTRALVRQVLSEYLDCPAADLQFRAGSHGKPFLASPETGGWQFNLSHSDGVVICAVSRTEQLGVDIEGWQRNINLRLADRFFARPEVAFLDQLPPEQRSRVFFEFWTLKESFIKALGTGLSTPLGDFAFDLRGSPRPTIRFLNPGLGESRCWQFLQFRIGTEYLGGLARAQNLPAPIRARVREITPLQSRGPWQAIEPV